MSTRTLIRGGYELRRTTTGITCTRHYGVAARTTGGGLTWIADLADPAQWNGYSYANKQPDHPQRP